MKNSLLTAFLLFTFITVNAQVENWCGTDRNNEAIFIENPELRTQMHEHLLRVTSGAYVSEDREGEFIIPIVVHILHDNGDGNISYEQVLSGLDQLNEDFTRTNIDAVDTRNTVVAPFEPIAANLEIRFELAKIDPDGNCTNGIERRFVGSQSYNANNSAKHYGTGGLNAWDRNYYFNVWIVNSIESGGGGTTLGYAEFPYAGGSSNYGIIIRNDYYGTTGTASGDRTLTHEVGHCLGLLHTFQGGCHTSSCDSNGDYCCDTPPVSEAHWSCSTSQNSCTGVPSGDPYGFDAYDQFENYMSYSPCQNMYSQDQKNIVHSNFESIGFLANLVNPDHYPETGVGLPDILCSADFISSNTTLCAGSTVSFFDDSYSNITGWSWTFEGGTPSTSTEENPIITYNTAGVYSVELEVTDGISTISTTKEEYVLVLSNPGLSLPYSQNFEALVSIPDYENFMITDEDNEDAWELFETVGYSGTQCAYIHNRGNDNRTKDELISPSIDLSGVDEDDPIVFNFKYAYKRRHSDDDEFLRFYISKDCGETWVLRKNIHGDDLGEEVQSSNYVPESKDEWYHVNITSINASYYTAEFRFKFQFENDNGNNIYLDDINMSTASMAGIADNDLNVFGLSVYPNPANESINIRFSTANSMEINAVILNAMGQEITTVYSGTIDAGNMEVSHSLGGIPAGVYFIRTINGAGIVEMVRFVVSF